MIQDYFEDITVYTRASTGDGLGGTTTSYTKLGTIKGLIQRASTQERLIASKLGIKDVFTLMTDVSANSFDIKSNYIVTNGTTTAITTTNELEGQQASSIMKNISQWLAESYEMEE